MIIIICITIFLGFLKPVFIAKNEQIPTFAIPPQITFAPETIVEPQKIWSVPNIDRMKKQGCVADGLLSGYNRTSKDIRVIQDSECYFFSRAIETWLNSPDFQKAQEIIDEIGRDDVQYGMFIAEALNKKENYLYYETNRRFDFDKMCKDGSKNFWGEHTCKPSLAEEEYRAYLKQITREAMDMGIQVFLFGQVYHQEEDLDKPYVQAVIADMREYARSKNMHIIIGAQTNSIDDEEYLQFFDFIEGGVGLHVDGTVEDNACFSRWYNNGEGWCWALLWNEPFRSKAKNVFVHLDWSGIKGDDMSTFARMSEELRHQTLYNLYNKFISQDVGFLMPILTPLPQDNDGCYGPRQSFYSPNMKYGCKDLDIINKIIR